MSSLRIGLIGASFVAADRMLPELLRHDVDVIGLCDSEPDRLALWADIAPPLVTTNVDELLDADIDAVYISSRNEQHAPHAIAAARAGKHILLEKPMALGISDARSIVHAAEDAGVLLAVNHHLPGSPLHATARRLVGEGRIGTLYSARINHAVLLPENMREWRIQPVPGAGPFLDITVHDAAVLNPLFGTQPRRVTALSVSQAPFNTYRTPDAVMTTIEYAPADNGIPMLAQTHDAFAAPYPGTSMEIHGSTGSIVIADAMTPRTEGRVDVIDDQGTHPIVVDCTDDLYAINIKAFIASIAGHGRPTATGGDGLLALQVALAAERSIELGRAVTLDELDEAEPRTTANTTLEGAL